MRRVYIIEYDLGCPFSDPPLNVHNFSWVKWTLPLNTKRLKSLWTGWQEEPWINHPIGGLLVKNRWAGFPGKWNKTHLNQWNPSISNQTNLRRTHMHPCASWLGPTVDERNPFRRKNGTMVPKWCEADFAHPQYDNVHGVQWHSLYKVVGSLKMGKHLKGSPLRTHPYRRKWPHKTPPILVS